MGLSYYDVWFDIRYLPGLMFGVQRLPVGNNPARTYVDNASHVYTNGYGGFLVIVKSQNRIKALQRGTDIFYRYFIKPNKLKWSKWKKDGHLRPIEWWNIGN